ncbi:MAG: NAD(P)/FAD-dependent oxidoreductase [Methanospirillum sp.]|uniref:NAD(P)/FAD-dependent oxidoreductase n=1 Tax=Methanospirillum sp. TaxID=45200 RepID=UPI0023711749|nr:NAD(P)/FAD-dependent oxidoreductase [Methanospirillum sp.]MDD1728005.1 NAD(P)/FAD-dependent oxidoreductase [Methanospirillum sp.]
MKSTYDMLVIGAGPAGAFAAKTAAEKGLSVLMVEKRPAPGAPVRCAEGVGKELLREFMKPDERWVAAEIERAHLIAPDGFRMEMNPEKAGSEVGYVLHRKVFDRELVWQAAAAGSDIMVKTRACSPVMENGVVKGALLEYNGTVTEVRAGVTIAADGVESKFARWCGVNTTVPLREMETCAQYLMTGSDIDPHATEFFAGNDVAPGGYVWIFPKGEKTANVGIGIGGDRGGKPGIRPIDYLNRFVKQHFPNGKTIELIAGGVSICKPLESTVADGLMIVGDAARVSDPLTGGGIYNALYTGKTAGEVAVDSLAKGDVSRKALMKYDETWRASYMGKALERNYQIKEVFVKLTDDDLNSIIHSVAKMNMSEFNTLSLIKNIITANPKVAMKLGKAGLKSLIDSI